MKRQDLEHLIRAAGAISRSKELVIIGSQARERDIDFVNHLVRHRLVSIADIDTVLSELPANHVVTVRTGLELAMRNLAP